MYPDGYPSDRYGYSFVQRYPLKNEKMKIVVVDYGAGIGYSGLSAIRRLGYQAVVSGEAAVIRSADRVIFPGVGQASAAMKKIQQTE